MSDNNEELVYLRSKLSNVQAELQTALNANAELSKGLLPPKVVELLVTPLENHITRLRAELKAKTEHVNNWQNRYGTLEAKVKRLEEISQEVGGNYWKVVDEKKTLEAKVKELKAEKKIFILAGVEYESEIQTLQSKLGKVGEKINSAIVNFGELYSYLEEEVDEDMGELLPPHFWWLDSDLKEALGQVKEGEK